MKADVLADASARLIDLADPFDVFDDWYALAQRAEPNDANAMALATVGPQSRPSLRMVLMKGYDRRGFVFYTNCKSRKGRDLEDNAEVALLFHWKSLRRQIRIEGMVCPVEDWAADVYFESRPRDSQLGAVISRQSQRLESRDKLLGEFADAKERLAEREVPRPVNWIGYRVEPRAMEAWLDRPHRLHERKRFTLESGTWQSSWLYP